MTLARLLDLLAFMLPAYAANMAPPLVRYWRGWNPPLSRRLLGAHKTVLGTAAGVAAAVVTAYLESLAGAPRIVAEPGRWLSLGLLLGVGAMSGDALKSLCKRSLGIEPGRRWVPFDQLDFQIGALLFAGHRARLSALDAAVILLVGFVGDLVVNRIAGWLGVKETSW